MENLIIKLEIFEKDDYLMYPRHTKSINVVDRQTPVTDREVLTYFNTRGTFSDSHGSYETDEYKLFLEFVKSRRDSNYKNGLDKLELQFSLVSADNPSVAICYKKARITSNKLLSSTGILVEETVNSTALDYLTSLLK